MVAMFHLNPAALLPVLLVVVCPVLSETGEFSPDVQLDAPVSVGDSVTLTCNISKNNLLQINWSKDAFLFGHSAIKNDTFSNFTCDRQRIVVGPPSELSISNVQHNDSGLYTCIGVFKKGRQRISWNLTVAEARPEKTLWHFLYITLPGVGVLLFVITAAVCLHRKLRSRRTNQDPVQNQTHLQSAAEGAVPGAERATDRRRNNKRSSQYMERLNSIYGL